MCFNSYKIFVSHLTKCFKIKKILIVSLFEIKEKEEVIGHTARCDLFMQQNMGGENIVDEIKKWKNSLLCFSFDIKIRFY